MSVFKELSIRFQEHKKALHEQRGRLAVQAQRFQSALENYLQLQSKTWINPKTGIEQSYVRLGKGDKDLFETCSPMELGTRDGVMQFSVSVTVETAPNEYPKRNHVFTMAVGAAPDGFIFAIDDTEGEFNVPAGDDADHVYERVCGSIVGRLLDIYDVRRIH